MSTSKIFATSLLIIGLIFTLLSGIDYLRTRNPTAGLKVQTNPASDIYINGQLAGSTPLEKYFSPGEIELKLVATATSSAQSTYEVKLYLNPQVFTVVHRDFGPTDAQTSGEIITLEPQSQRSPSLSVISSVPDTASVSLDDQPLGFTPFVTHQISPQTHQFLITAPGFSPRSFSALAVTYHKLVITTKLAGFYPDLPPGLDLITLATPSAAPTKVRITSTPTGFLRLRQAPSTTAAELGQLTPGKTYTVIDRLPDWLLLSVDLPATSSGWVSSQYTQIIP